MQCSNCGKCCEGTEMLLSKEDIERLERLGGIVLVSPWDFQSGKRGDIIWRYKRNQAEWLRSKGYLKI